MRTFGLSIGVTVLCLAAALVWGGWIGVYLVAVLAVLEVSLSFDNAVVNASVLKQMDLKWQQIFLTVGILVAVFGMRLLFPLVIVSVASGLGIGAVADMALSDPEQYALHLHEAHVQIAVFGGMFLLLVFLSFIFDEEKDTHWLGRFEKMLGGLGKIEAISIIVALALLLFVQAVVPEGQRLMALLAGITGIILFVSVNSLDTFFQADEEGAAVSGIAKRSGVMGFLYLEILDASFSFDGVIGAFAITKDVVTIMLGLAIGAMFVRSLTVYLVRKGTLDEYVFLEHGAHYAIGSLALIMLANTVQQVPDWFTGFIGVSFIGLAMLSSIRYKCAHGGAERPEHA